MASPGLSAQQISPDDVGELSDENDSTDDYATPSFTCFNTQPWSSGHYFSAKELYKRKVWIGYLAPARQKEGFRGLPSFNDLKANCKNLSPPFPPAVDGTAREARNAVCRGCVGPNSPLITMREISYIQKRKLFIMPLDGDDEPGLFCIMIPQANDRSLPGLQCFRPYEYLDDANGQTFVNKIMLLTLRNTSLDAGTLNTVLAVLSPEELSLIERRNGKRPRMDSGDEPAPMSFLQTPKKNSPSPAIDPSKHAKTRHNIQDRTRTKRQRIQRSRSQSTHTAAEQENSDGDDDQKHVPHNRQQSIAKMPRTQERTPISPDIFDPPPPNPAFTQPEESIPVELIDNQAKKVCIVWTVNDDGLDVELVHTIYECKTFSGLLSLLQEDTEVIPPVATVLAETKMWRLTYTLPDGTKKAVITRKGTEVVFDRLQAALAQSSIWKETPGAKLDIELVALSKPGPAAAT